MGWRRDEVWFDTDVLWFREQPRRPFGALALEVPAFAANALEPALSCRSRRGSTASRQRRLAAQAARRRRLATRTVPAVALVLGSATMLPISALRHGSGGQDAGPLQEDPPSLTFRFDLAGLEVPEAPFLAQGRLLPEARGAKLARAAELATGRVAPRHVGRPPVLRPSGRRHAASRRGARLGHVEPDHGQRSEPAAPALRQRAHDPDDPLRDRRLPHRACGRAAGGRRRHQLP